MNLTLKRQKSISSHAASISAWCAVFDWPSIVAAFSVCAPRARRAARRRAGRRRRAPPTACATSRAPPRRRRRSRARTSACAALVHGGEHVRAVVRLDRLERVAGAHLFAADDERDLERLRLHLGQPDAQLFALGRARGVAANRLVVRLGDAEDSVGAHAAILGQWPMAATRVAYEVDGWGVGELWLDGGRVVWHDAAARAPNVCNAGSARATWSQRLAGVLRTAKSSRFEDVELDLGVRDAVPDALRAALRKIPRGEVVTYGELAALAGAPGAARAAGIVLRAQPPRPLRAVPPRRRAQAGSARTARSASTTNDGSWSSKVCSF